MVKINTDFTLTLSWAAPRFERKDYFSLYSQAPLHATLEDTSLTTDSYFGKTRPPGGRLYNKKGFLTLFWWENMISDLLSGF